jgi:hypothetical protein
MSHPSVSIAAMPKAPQRTEATTVKRWMNVHRESTIAGGDLGARSERLSCMGGRAYQWQVAGVAGLVLRSSRSTAEAGSIEDDSTDDLPRLHGWRR